MDEAIAAAASEAVARYHETVQLSRSRLGEVQRAGADERENRAAWLTCMLITTSEEALRSKEALMHAREQRAQDQLHTAQLDLQEVEAVRERVACEPRDELEVSHVDAAVAIPVEAKSRVPAQ